MSFWPEIDGDSTTYVQKVIVDSNIPDDAKREILELLDLRQPDNGMRLVLDIQYQFDDVETLRHSYPTHFMYFLRGAIRDYKKKYEQYYEESIYANKAITKIASVDLTDIEYCDTWFEEEREDG